MRRGFQSLVVLLSAIAVPAAGGTVRGRIEVVEKGGRKAADVAEAVIWIEGPRVAPPPSSATIVMSRKAFVPRVVVVPVGGTVAFPNQDPIFHNVFSVSGRNAFDLDLYKKPKSGVWTARHPGRSRSRTCRRGAGCSRRGTSAPGRPRSR
jgi:plastocyanin